MGDLIDFDKKAKSKDLERKLALYNSLKTEINYHVRHYGITKYDILFVVIGLIAKILLKIDPDVTNEKFRLFVYSKIEKIIKNEQFHESED